LVPLEQLDAHWLPYLRGRATLEEAIAALLTGAPSPALRQPALRHLRAAGCIR
jgi:hypothetical protein